MAQGALWGDGSSLGRDRSNGDMTNICENIELSAQIGICEVNLKRVDFLKNRA